MVLRYATVVLTAAVLALTAALGASVVAPKEAEAASTVAVKTCTGGTFDLTTDEKRMLDLHNQTRASKGLRMFCVHPALMKAARAHSQEMIEKDYFSHNSFNGETFSARLKRFGYNWRFAGENIAWGSGSYGTPDNRFKAWMNSTGHRANILNKSFREIGIGAYTGDYTDKSTGRTYSGTTMWTADFGAR
jgi:uncharacterized protein YkwD